MVSRAHPARGLPRSFSIISSTTKTPPCQPGPQVAGRGRVGNARTHEERGAPGRGCPSKPSLFQRSRSQKLASHNQANLNMSPKLPHGSCRATTAPPPGNTLSAAQKALQGRSAIFRYDRTGPRRLGLPERHAGRPLALKLLRRFDGKQTSGTSQLHSHKKRYQRARGRSKGKHSSPMKQHAPPAWLT